MKTVKRSQVGIGTTSDEPTSRQGQREFESVLWVVPRPAQRYGNTTISYISRAGMTAEWVRTV